MGRRTEGRVTLLSQALADGDRAVLVFRGAGAAEAFRIVEGLGEEWEAIGGAAGGVADLLDACAEAGVKYACLDPPTALTREAQGESPVIPLSALLGHLSDPPNPSEGPKGTDRDRPGGGHRERAARDT